MHSDRFGQRVSTASARAVERNDAAVDLLFALQPGAPALVDQALALDPEFALAHCTKARALLQGGDAAGARRWAARGRELAEGLTARERNHAEIVRQAIHNEPTALAAVAEHADAHPRDAVPLSFALGVYGLLGFGGFADFHARQAALLDRVAPAWGDEDWWFLAARGWACVEAGRRAQGVAMLERALALNPRNANAAHGRVHGYYEQGDAEGGEAFLAEWLPGYDRGAALHGHLAWHAAFFALQRDEVDRALATYRNAIGPAVSAALPLFTVIDGASFALRALLGGHALAAAERRELADFAAARLPAAGVPFANVHLAMAYAGAGDWDRLESLRGQVAELLEDGRQRSGAVVVRACDAVAAYGAGEYALTAALLEESAPEWERLGGSHAQRDLLADLAIAAHLRAGAVAAAEALAAKRWTRRATHLRGAWLRRLVGAV